MKQLLLIFTLFCKLLHSQNHRIPVDSTENFLLYKSDSVSISYYWDDDDTGEESYGMYPYSFSLFIKVTNLTEDSMFCLYKIKTIELKSSTNITNDFNKGYSKKLDYFPMKPKSSFQYGIFSKGNITDFVFKSFKIKYKSGKVIDLTKTVNSKKQEARKEIIELEENRRD